MEVEIIENVLSSKVCLQMRARAEHEGFSATGRHYPDGYRNNDRAVVDDSALATQLFAALRERLPQTLEREGQRYRLIGFNSRFRFCRYRNGQSFSIHRDGPQVRLNGERSFLTCQIYLNDGAEFRGGATRFYDGNGPARVEVRSVAPVIGRAILFDHDFWHDGEAVSAGEKCIMRTDLIFAPELAPSPLALAGYVWALLPTLLPTLSPTLSSTARGMLMGSRDGGVRWLREDLTIERKHLVGDSSVMCLAERGERLWAGTRSGMLVRVDGEQMTAQVAHDGALLAMVTYGDALVTSGADGHLRFWNADGVLVRDEVIAHSWVRRLATHAGGIVAACEDGSLLFWRDGRIVAVKRYDAPLRALAASSRGVLVGSADGRAHRWSAECAAEGRSLHLHEGPVMALLWHGDEFFSGGEDGAVIRTRGAQSALLVRHTDFVQALAVTSAGLWSAGYAGVRVTQL